MKILLRKGSVWMGGRLARETDVAVADGRIVGCGRSLKFEADRVIDCAGLEVLPGLIDVHAHIREPGAPEKESFESAAQAAANGGVTTLVMMPNTDPAIDRPEWVKYVRLRSAEVGGVDVVPAAALSVGRKGESLAPYSLLMEAGARIFTDDGTHIQDAGLMKRALEAVGGLGGMVMVHAEDTSLSAGGMVHFGAWAERNGVAGIPGSAEAVIVARDCLLSKEAGARVHFTHLSAKESVEMLRIFRRWGTDVTGDVTFHHLYFSERDLRVPDRMWKVNPPLRGREDQEALREAIKLGHIDCVCTDHAPHGRIPREATWEERPFGFSSLDVVFSLLNTVFDEDEVPFGRRLEWMSSRPSQLFGLKDRGRIREGLRADLIVVDRKKTFTVSEEDLLSRGKNCPYLGMKLGGKVLWTVCGGKIVKEEGKVVVGSS